MSSAGLPRRTEHGTMSVLHSQFLMKLFYDVRNIFGWRGFSQVAIVFQFKLQWRWDKETKTERRRQLEWKYIARNPYIYADDKNANNWAIKNKSWLMCETEEIRKTCQRTGSTSQNKRFIAADFSVFIRFNWCGRNNDKTRRFWAIFASWMNENSRTQERRRRLSLISSRYVEYCEQSMSHVSTTMSEPRERTTFSLSSRMNDNCRGLTNAENKNPLINQFGWRSYRTNNNTENRMDWRDENTNSKLTVRREATKKKAQASACHGNRSHRK